MSRFRRMLAAFGFCYLSISRVAYEITKRTILRMYEYALNGERSHAPGADDQTIAMHRLWAVLKPDEYIVLAPHRVNADFLRAIVT